MQNLQNVQAITGAGSNASSGPTEIDVTDYTTPNFQASGGLNAQSNGTTPATPTIPASQANDILILLCFAQNSNTNFGVTAGWTEIIQLNAGAHKVAFFWKRHTGSESNPSVTNAGWTNTNIMAAKVDAYRGCVTTGTPYEGLVSNSSASAALTGAAVTTSGIKRLAVQLWGRLGNTATAPDSNWAERADLGTSGGGGCRFYVDTRDALWPSTIPACSRGASGVAYGIAGLSLIGNGPSYTPTTKTPHTGLWVWDFIDTVIGDTDEENILLNECVNSGITDLYCYTFESAIEPSVSDNAVAIRSFISRCSQLSIHVWGLDGSREYFSDLDGPQQLYDSLAAVVAYNAGSAADERFTGFAIDMEPQDVGLGLAFHNGVAQSALSTTPGSGDWQSTEALDREFLMRDWIAIHQEMFSLCHTSSLRLSTALPTHLDDYFGEPIVCTYNSVQQNVFLHLKQYCDAIAMMSYSTTPAVVIERLVYEFGQQIRQEIGFSLETALGVGSGISYGDTVGKQTKSALSTDRAVTNGVFNGVPEYVWFNLHDWAGYKALSPASVDTSNPF